MNRLTVEHQQAIEEVSDAAIERITALVRRADPDDIDAWFLANRKDILQIVYDAWRENRTLAGAYMIDHAAAEGVALRGVYGAVWDSGKVWTSVQKTGPAAFKAAIRVGSSPEAASLRMINSLQRSLIRHMMDGSRGSIAATVRRSSQMPGYRRVSRYVPCTFCAMLISRGAVYTDPQSFQAHDGDRCVFEPSYRKGYKTPQERRLEELWNESTKGLSGDEAIKAFSKAYQTSQEGEA